MPNLPPIKPVESWLIVQPNGIPLVYTARRTRRLCIEDFCCNWGEKQACGYRCVKLLIGERGGER